MRYGYGRYKDEHPIDLTTLTTRPAANGNGLELFGLIDPARLKSARTETMKKIAPRPNYYGLHVAGFDPNGPAGQVCPLKMHAVQAYAEGGAGPIAPKPGVRERDLGRLYLYEKKSAPFERYLFGKPASPRLTHLLRELQETAGSKLKRLEIIIRDTPRKNEPKPTWTAYLRIPE